MAMIHGFLPFPPKFRTSRAGNQFPFAWQELQLIRTDKWAEEVQRDWRRLRKASEAVRNDPDLVAACIDVSRGEAIKFAGEVGGGRFSPGVWLREELGGVGVEGKGGKRELGKDEDVDM